MSIVKQPERPDLKYWLAFSQFTKIGPIRFKKIYNHFPDLAEAWAAPANELSQAGLEPEIIEELVAKRAGINPNEEYEKLKRERVQVLTILDQNYPKLLKEIYNPPALLYYRGSLKALNEFTLAVVGTRKITTYGQQVTQEIVRDAVKNGLTIVSGLALGVDALAHQSALEAKGQTVAVLGSGLASQNIYPAANRHLATKIVEQGGILISEFPLTMLPLKHNFPIRNRIISGLSLGTLVVEANLDSGALITAQAALEQNREVFAIPGNIFNPGSAGPNNLIKLGAKAVTSVQDLMEALNLNQVAIDFLTKQIVPETKEEEILLKFLTKEPVHIDQLVLKSKLDTATVNSTIIMMEIKGKVKNLGGANYVLSR